MSKKEKSIEKLLEEVLVPKEEHPYEVPKNWVWAFSGYIAKWGSGGTPSRRRKEYYDGSIPWIKTGELNDGIISVSEETITEEGLKNSSAKIFLKGSIAIAMYGATIGKLGLLGINTATNQACAVGEPYNFIDSKYMFYYFLARRNDLIALGKGGAQPNISQAIIKEFPFLLPPLHEQKRIVDKVDRLFAKIDEVKRLIEEAKETFEMRRASILNRAFRGELLSTPEYGEYNENKNIPYILPKGWKWMRFREIASVKSNLVNPTDYQDFSHIAPDNIEKKSGRLLQFQTIREDKVKSPKHLFKKDQILYSKIRPYLSKVIITNFDGLCSADMYPIETNINIQYLYYYMLSPFFVEKASSAGSRSVLPKINQKELGELLVPVPEPQVQKLIVNKIQNLFEKENLFHEIMQLEEEINNIKQSILFKAFHGEFGTNHPDEESSIKFLKEVLKPQ